MRKIGNIYNGSGGMKKIGNIHDKNFGVKNDNMQNALLQAQQEAQRANSWQGMAMNTIRGIPQAIGQVAMNTIQHPIDTLLSVGSGVYKGAVKPLVDIQKYTNPAMLIPGTRQNMDRVNQMLDYQPKNDTSMAMKQGFQFAGQVAPYEVASEIFGGVKALKNTPLLAKYLGYTVPGQVMSDKPITDIQGRGKQLALDSLLFGLTGGLKKTPELKTGTQTGVPDIQSQIGVPAAKEAQVLALAKNSSLPKSISLSKKNVKPLQEGGVQDPVQKVIEALSGAKSKLGDQAKLYSEERARRVARVAAMGEKVGGEQGYFAQLGQLKGQLPKVSFESIRKDLKQPDIDSLFQKVQDHNLLTPFEKVTGKTGLSKLLGAEGGAMPNKSEIAVLSEVFPKEFIDTIASKRPLMQKLFESGQDILNVPRSMMASFDLSAPLRQGIFLIGKPKQWAPAFKDMFKYAFSEKSYQGLVQEIQRRPTYMLMKESKLALTDMTKGLGGREERFMSNLAEQIPGIGKIVRGSDRAYTGFLNKLRADVFDDLVGKLGKDESGSIARFVNSATGRGELLEILKSSNAVLNGAFFSPRLMAARINMLNPQYYMSLSAPVRKEALKSLLTFGGVITSILGLAKMGGAEVGTKPQSADFGKIKVGNTRYDILGGFQQYAVLASRLATNTMINSTTGKEFQLGEGYKPTTRTDVIARFFQSKESPVLGYLAGLFSGKDAMGQDFNYTAEALNRFIPMLAQDLSDMSSDKGLAQGAAMEAPGIFGVGTQTYTDQIPVMEKTPTGQPTVKWNPYPSIGEKIVNSATGTELSQIPQDQWAGLATEKSAETQRQIQVDAAKTRVLDTGKPETIGDTYIYIQNGIVKTKKLGNNDRTPLKDKLLYEEINKRAQKTNPFYQP